MADKNKIQLKIRNAKEIIFDGEVDRISSFNNIGPFDIYPQHANFISIIVKKLTLYNDKQMINEIEFEKAVLEIKKDIAKIFLGIDAIDIDEQIKKLEKDSTAESN